MSRRAFNLSATFLSLLFLSAPFGSRGQTANSKAAETAVNEANLPFSKTTCTYKTVGDCKIEADVFRAAGDAVRPCILWIHGGALIMGNRRGIHPDQLSRYIGSGFTVVSIDYRLAPETKLKGIIEDLRDAYQWIRTNGPELLRIDPDRIAVIGHSAGGYLTLMSGFSLEPRPRALISFYGYGDIVGPWYSRPDPFYSQKPAVSKEEAYRAVGEKVLAADPGDRNRGLFYLYCRQQGLWPKEVAGHDPDTEPRAFDRYCPIRNVTKEFPPTMLLHGDKDTDVPFEQSIEMSRELKRQGVECELIALSNRGHGFDGGRDRMKDPEIAETFDRVVAFLKKHTAKER